MATVQSTSSGLSYVGNPDFRGYLNYLATTNPNDPFASAAISGGNTGMGLVDNTGKTASDATIGQFLGGNTAADTTASVNNFKSYIGNAYNTFQGLSGGGSAGGSTGGTSTNASDLAYLDDTDSRLRDQLAGTKTALSQGKQQIEDTYNESANRTTADRNTADTGYNTQRDNTTQDKLKAIDTVNTGARTLADSVRRILGLAAGNNSTAYRVAAPQLIARDTTTKRSGVNDTFARNYSSIGTAQDASDLKFQRALDDLLAQKKDKSSGLESGILQEEQGIQAQLGQNALTRAQINGGTYSGTRAALQPFTDAINSRQSEIDALFDKYRTPYALQDTTPVAANLDTYQTPTTQLNTGAGGNSGQPQDNSGMLAPFLLALKKQFQPAV